VRGVLTVALRYPFATPQRRRQLRSHCSRGLLRTLGIRLHIEGEDIAPGTMLVANHISWVDIFVINACAPAAFVSKAEVRQWPLIGWLAAQNDTIFLRRGSRGHARIINAETAAVLDAGDNVAIFPEGTTTDGSHMLHFHAALLQPAIACGHAVQAVALSYQDRHGNFSRRPAYDGDLSLGQCTANIVGTTGLVAVVRIARPVLATPDMDRKRMAAATHETIAALRSQA
jgi:1-acyl-sn-glycerol-3-phosphate acyltransferase